jgi:hypothetical protein
MSTSTGVMLIILFLQAGTVQQRGHNETYQVKSMKECKEVINKFSDPNKNVRVYCEIDPNVK